ncbi:MULTISPECIES: restriction endonuclease [Flavobacterium]|uniref:Restriction endonuclease type IV Mrr domain-containing protein n=1 Tax=Flavobacterium hankyongi TaxID=1176532 RepID=A0ABP9ABN0_9FLAO|nr:restriction endonuclease [Flavobacterium sp. N1846]
MKYKVEDIDFKNVSPRGFENLCYDLLVQYNFHNLIWREGGADNGRDIEASYNFANPINNVETKWFFECKHYSNGVPVNELTSKIAWADAEQPNYLVFFISSYLTNATRTWLEMIQSQKSYKIITVEGEEIKNKIVKYSDLVERYFSQNQYEDLFRSIKDFKVKFGIKPSYEVLKEIIENIDYSKLEIEDFGFIIVNFYMQYNLFDLAGEYTGNFDITIIDKILAHLKQIITNDELNSFNKYKNDFDVLGGVGFLDEMENIGYLDEEDEVGNFNFQFYHLHLFPSKETENWKVGLYVFVIFEDVAFEIFNDDETQIRIINDFNPDKISEIAINKSGTIIEDYKSYLEIFE